MTGGIVARRAETRLTERAADFLAAGAADPVALIAYICQLPNPPRVVAEHMAAALFEGRIEFARDDAGQWYLSPTCRDASSTVATTGAGVSPGATRWASPPADAQPAAGEILRPLDPGDLLSSLSYVVVDVETTGTRASAGDRITEVAAVVVRNGAVVELFETLINPQRPIPPMISALTQITSAMVRKAPLFRDVCHRLLAVMSGHVFVAHNAGFDWRFVTSEVARASGRRLEGRQLCTVRLARRLLPRLRSRSLDSVASYYGVEIGARHRAGGDALATAQVLIRLLDDARDRGFMSWTELDRMIRTRKGRGRRGRRSAMPRWMDREGGA